MKPLPGARLLGVDYGSRRVGIAISDPLNIIARGLLTLDNGPNIVHEISELVTRHQIGTIVVGLPLNLRGEKGAKAKEVEEFIGLLTKAVNIPVVTSDERFTTTMALATQRSMGVKKKQRQSRAHIDEMAASILLQGYLDAHRTSPTR